MALWQLFLGINHEEFARMVFGFEQDKIHFCWFVSRGCGIFTSSSFLETGNNRFHRMLGGMKWNLQIDKQLQFSTCTNSAWCMKEVLEQITCQWLWLEAMSLELHATKRNVKMFKFYTFTSQVSLMKKLCLEREGEYQSLNYVMVWSIMHMRL